jgi:hypothetical protein
METLIGQKPESKFDANKIVLKPVKIQIKLLQILFAVSTYQDASKIIHKNFFRSKFESGSKK